MALTDRQAAMNAIISTAKKIANIYRNASEEKLDREISGLCLAIAYEHNEVIEAIEREILDLGEVPREPDPEKQVLEEAFTHIKAQLSENTEYTLLEELQGYEKQLAEEVAKAIELDLPESTTGAIDDLKEVISRSFRRLSEAKSKQT